MSNPTGKTNENLSPEKLNSPRQRRKITKEGPPSRAELEERKRILDEYKRAREEKRRQDMAKRNGRVLGVKKELSTSMESTMEVETVQSSDPVAVMEPAIEKALANDTMGLVEMSCDVASSEPLLGVEAPEPAVEETAVSITIECIEPQCEEVASPEPVDAEMHDIEAPAIIADSPDNVVGMSEATAEIAESVQKKMDEVAEKVSECTEEVNEVSVATEVVVETVGTVEDAARPNGIEQGNEQTATEVVLPEISAEKTMEVTEYTAVSSPVPKWKSDEGFWLNNRVLIEYSDSKTDAIVLEPVGKPHLRLFKLSQIETQLACGHKELASAMLRVVCAPGQKKGNDPMLRASVAARIEKIRPRFAAEESTDMLVDEVEPEPTLPLPKPGHFSGSDSEQDEAGSKLAVDVEEASRRHSIILSDLCVTPRSNHTRDFRSVQKAARFLAEDEELMASVKKRLYETVEAPATEAKPCKTRRVNVDLAGESSDEDVAGSTVKYALLTPSKRIQEMLHTDLVISPVRRSVRNFTGEDGHHHHQQQQQQQVKLYDGIEEVDMTEVGYMPNRSIPGSPYKKTPKKLN